MTKRIVLYPYKMSSGGSRRLKEAIKSRGVPCIRVFAHKNYKPNRNDIIINWGASWNPSWKYQQELLDVPFLNKPINIDYAANKVVALEKLQLNGNRIPVFTTDFAEACSWFEEVQSPVTVYCRTLLNSHSGKGIVIANSVDELIEAPLYTKSISVHRDEYRMHICRGTFIDKCIKIPLSDERLTELHINEINMDIRSYKKGWQYARRDYNATQAIEQEALSCVEALGLDFGIVDICAIYSDATKTELVDFCTFEVNTAPGLTANSTALNSYANYFTKLAND